MYTQAWETLRYMGKDGMVDNVNNLQYLKSYRTLDQTSTYMIDELWSHNDLPSSQLL